MNNINIWAGGGGPIFIQSRSHAAHFSTFDTKCKQNSLFQAKCQGKEHMIESEIAILSAISHSNIIQLEEVFDFPCEKYLVMEYVSGGDLFDAIAHDIKYTETVARDMIKDLANALQVYY